MLMHTASGGLKPAIARVPVLGRCASIALRLPGLRP